MFLGLFVTYYMTMHLGSVISEASHHLLGDDLQCVLHLQDQMLLPLCTLQDSEQLQAAVVGSAKESKTQLQVLRNFCKGDI